MCDRAIPLVNAGAAAVPGSAVVPESAVARVRRVDPEIDRPNHDAPDDAAGDVVGDVTGDVVDEPAALIDPTLDGADVIAAARRRHGVAGAMLAAGMVAINDVYLGRKPKEEAPIVIAAPTEPHDVDRDGITVPVDTATSVFAPPQPPSNPYASLKGRGR